MTLSLIAAVVMLGGKLTAYFLTGSIALFSDAAESVVHGFATALAAFSLWYASVPPDDEHPYGHGRIAYFSAGFEGALVFVASITVMWNAVVGLIHGVELERLGVGLAIAAALAFLNLLLGLSLLRVGKARNSLILIANGRHVLSDVWTTVGALVGVGGVMLTGITWLDPIAALLAGGWIMFSGIALIRTSYVGLMDKIDPKVLERLKRRLEHEIAVGDITEYHALRCREVYNVLWVDVDVLVPGRWTVIESHDRITRLEMAVQDEFPDAKVYITTHIEPNAQDHVHPEGHPDDHNPTQAAPHG